MYQPTEEEMRQANAVMDRCGLAIGRFIMTWTRIEKHMRALEFMHVGDRRFEPVEDLYAIDLKKRMRFRERVNLLPDRPEGAKFGLHNWLIEANKTRNLIIHGDLLFMSRESEGENVATPVIQHSDFGATLLAGKGFPNIGGEIHAPSYRGSVRPDKLFDVPKLDQLTAQAQHVEEVLVNIISEIHGLKLNRSAL